MMVIIVVLGLIALLVELYYIAKPFSAVMHRNKDEKKNHVLYSDALPSVSIIVVTKNSDRLLKAYLPLLLEQEYPVYEVILVDDGSWDGTEDIVRNYQKIYGDKLYYTKLPKDSRVISTKKLGITVGAKAAHYDVLLLTEPSTRPFSMYWIEKMVRNFITGTEYILGLNVYNDNRNFVQHMIAYDTLLSNIKSLGFAILGKPYSCSGKNLAYLKSTFFENSGFAGLLHTIDGDDSLLINTHSTSLNTRIESSRAGHTLDMDSLLYKEWRYVKMREMHTEQEFFTRSKVYEFTEPIARFVFILMAILSIILFPILQPSWWIAGISVMSAALLIQYVWRISIINRIINGFNQPKFWLYPIIYDIYLPIAKGLIFLFVRVKKSN